MAGNEITDCGGMPERLAGLLSVMAPERPARTDGPGMGEPAPDPEVVRLARGLDEVRAADAAERFVLPPAARPAPLDIHGFELGTDTLRLGGGCAASPELAWIDRDGDGAVDDLMVSVGRTGLVLVDLAADGLGVLQPLEDLLFG